MIKKLPCTLLVALFMLGMNVNAQTNDKDLVKAVLTDKNMSITWLGADFSHVKILDSLGCTPAHFANFLAHDINNLVVAESPKFDFAKFLQKKSFVSRIEEVNKSNESVNPNDLTQNTSSKLDETTIKKIVSGYNLEGKEGIGVVLIYESVSKLNLRATMYLTFINMPDGKIVLSKKVTGKPGGFGLRNFWAATIYNVLKDYQNLYLKVWKAELGIK